LATPKVPTFPKELLDSLTPLIASIAQLMWPIIVLVIVFLFRQDISGLLGRIREGEIFGQKFKADPEVDKFQASVQEAQEEIPSSVVEEKQYEQEMTILELFMTLG